MFCQKCRTPLKLDSSLEELNPAAFDLLVGSTGKTIPDRKSGGPSQQPYSQERRDLYDKASKNASPPLYRKSVHGSQHGSDPAAQARFGHRDNPGMSFVMLTESQVVPHHVAQDSHDLPIRSRGKQQQQQLENGAGQTHEQQQNAVSEVERTRRLFEVISARSDIDHPICIECAELLVEGLQKRLVTTTKERDAYIGFMKEVSSNIPTEEEVEAAETSLEKQLQAEKAAFEELLQLEAEKATIDAEIVELETQSRELDQEEERFWRERNAFALELSEFQAARDALNTKYDHDSKQLERLQRTNVYNDTFCIGHDGYFGTMNGLRLGRLPSQPVEWSEINAAWGQTLLLLATVAEKLRFEFQGYVLHPMGSSSKIAKLEYSTQSPSQSTTSNHSGQTQTGPAAKSTMLDLHHTGGLSLLRVHRGFDSAMVAFLDCLAQLGVHVERQTSDPAYDGDPLVLPYIIKNGKIGDASIRLGSGFQSNDEVWTKACKYTLTCCKFLLAHASNVGSSGGGRDR